MSVHDVIVLDDDIRFEHEINAMDDIFNQKIRRKMHRNSKKCRLICDLYEQINVLRKQNELMSTLCGFKEFSYIVNAAVAIQSVVRGWILRKDKYVFERSVDLYLCTCRMFLARKHFKDMKKAVIFIQAYYRGFSTRKLALGKAIKLISQHRNEIVQLELLTLRLTSMMWYPSESVERQQIHVS
jgi:hypothetical protein